MKIWHLRYHVYVDIQSTHHQHTTHQKGHAYGIVSVPKVSSAKRLLTRRRLSRPALMRMRRRASYARWRTAWPRLSDAPVGGRGFREARFFENLSKISQKFASVNENLPSKNLPLSREKSVFTPTFLQWYGTRRTGDVPLWGPDGRRPALRSVLL